jgi:hypothetical protein
VHAGVNSGRGRMRIWQRWRFTAATRKLCGIKVTDKGQVTIPPALQKRLGLLPRREVNCVEQPICLCRTRGQVRHAEGTGTRLSAFTYLPLSLNAAFQAGRRLRNIGALAAGRRG